MSGPEISPIELAVGNLQEVLELHRATVYPDKLAKARGRWMARLVVNSLPNFDLIPDSPVGDEFQDTTRFEDLGKEYAAAVAGTVPKKEAQDSGQPLEQVAAGVIMQEYDVRWGSGIYQLIRQAHGGAPVETKEPQMDEFLRGARFEVIDAESQGNDPDEVISKHVKREVKYQIDVDTNQLNGKRRR